MDDPRLVADISEIKILLREQSVRQQNTDLMNEARMTRVEGGITEIKADVASINKRSETDHDDIVRMKQQLTIRPTVAAIVSTLVSLTAAYFGMRPPAP